MKAEASLAFSRANCDCSFIVVCVVYYICLFLLFCAYDALFSIYVNAEASLALVMLFVIVFVLCMIFVWFCCFARMMPCFPFNL